MDAVTGNCTKQGSTAMTLNRDCLHAQERSAVVGIWCEAQSSAGLGLLLHLWAFSGQSVSESEYVIRYPFRGLHRDQMLFRDGASWHFGLWSSSTKQPSWSTT